VRKEAALLNCRMFLITCRWECDRMSATCSTVKAELGVAAEGAFVGVDMAHALKRWICEW